MVEISTPVKFTSANLFMSMSLVAHRVDNSREMKDRHH